MSQFEYIQGIAGTGKSFLLQEMARQDSNAVLCATTGIAAVNLGAGTTIHSFLWYYNSDSLLDAWTTGKLTYRLGEVYGKMGVRRILIDEVSMMPATDLSVICLAIEQLNAKLTSDHKPELCLTLAGDFAQLPPVDGEFAFVSEHWDKFEANTTILRHIYRQADQEFIEALQLVREGHGKAVAPYFKPFMHPFVDAHFEGTSVYPYNKMVDAQNSFRLGLLKTAKIQFENTRNGKPRAEWKLIPNVLEAKQDALVMVLANQRDEEGAIKCANGDLGYIRGFAPNPEKRGEMIALVDLMRPGAVNPISVAYVTRLNEQPVNGHKTVVGSINYMPLRLAWATTVHKCLAPTTKIPVQNKGMIPIEFVRPGDYIDTGTGELARVKALSFEEKALYEITTSCGHTVLSSEKHRWKTDKGFVETKKLKGKEVYVTPKTIIDGTAQIDKVVAQWLGLIIGDGNYSDRKEGQIHFGNNAKELRDLFMSTAIRLGGNPNTRRDNRGCHLTSLPLRLRLEQWGLDYVTATKKRIPKVVWESGRLAWAGCLKGLFDSDGSIKNSRLVYCTMSKGLAKDVQLLLLLLGIRSTLGAYKCLYHGTEKQYYHIRITAAMLSKYKALIGFSHKKRAKELAAWKPNRIVTKYKETDKIVSVKLQQDSTTVVDIELETIHEVVFDGLIGSNSQGLTLDNVQVDFRSKFFTETPGMLYVALSRARTSQGLRLIGSARTFAQRCSVNPKIKEFL